MDHSPPEVRTQGRRQGRAGAWPPNAPVAPLAEGETHPAMTCGKTVSLSQSLVGPSNDQILAPPLYVLLAIASNIVNMIIWTWSKKWNETSGQL